MSEEYREVPREDAPPSFDRRASSISDVTLDEAKVLHRVKERRHLAQFTRLLLAAILAVLIWLSGGATFYSMYYNWPWLTALYYSAQAGLSIGFGALAETDDISRAYTVAHVLLGSSAIAGALGLFISNVLEKQSVNWDKERMALLERDLNMSEEEDLEESNNSAVLTAVTFTIWMGLGVAYGYYYEGWSFITSIYFSVTACSTAGLQAPTAPVDENSLNMLYVAVFVTIGVPLYGMVLGSAANVLIEDYLDRKTQRKLTKIMKQEEIEFAMSFQDDDDTIEWGEYLAFSCLRLGLLDIDMLQAVKDQFDDLDVDDSGFLEYNEIRAAMMFGKYDVEHDGVLMGPEFLLLVDGLVHEPEFEHLSKWLQNNNTAQRIFDDINDMPDRLGELDDSVSRAEFVGFFNFITDEKYCREWFQENGDAWLRGQAKLPKIHISHNDGALTVVVDGKEQVQHTSNKVKFKNNELRHFQQWLDGSDGSTWLLENETAFVKGEAALPNEAFLTSTLEEEDESPGLSFSTSARAMPVDDSEWKDAPVA